MVLENREVQSLKATNSALQLHVTIRITFPLPPRVFLFSFSSFFKSSQFLKTQLLLLKQPGINYASCLVSVILWSSSLMKNLYLKLHWSLVSAIFRFWLYLFPCHFDAGSKFLCPLHVWPSQSWYLLIGQMELWSVLL